METPWLELTGGAPDEPDMLEALGAPGPWEFLQRLLRDVAGVDVGQAVNRGDDEGRFGSVEIGVRYRRDRSAFGVSCRVESYGLPGIDLTWTYGLDTVNVAGPVGYRHGSLRVRFADDRSRAAFEKLWSEVYSRRLQLRHAVLAPGDANA